ncbi:MAG: hypothetical protein WBP26_02070 [Candidatus Saccharimonadales bacterium]
MSSVEFYRYPDPETGVQFLTTLTGGGVDRFSIRADQLANAAACRDEARWITDMVPLVENPGTTNRERVDMLRAVGIETDSGYPFAPRHVDDTALLNRLYVLRARAEELDGWAEHNSRTR